MAAEMMVGAFLSSSFDYLIDKIASSPIADCLRGGKQSDFDVDKLETVLYSLTAVLADAEQKQIKNLAVQKWLEKLQDAVHDAEDLFGEIEYDALKLKVEAESRTRKRKVSEFVPNISSFFNSDEGERKTKMEEISRKLENLVQQINILGLAKGVEEEKPLERLPSTSLIVEEVFGRDADIDAVMKLLMSNDVGSQKICVIPIVGMGGVGKTTLAQALFNDKKVEEMFEPKIWVCVSDQFDALRVTKTILKAVTSDAYADMDLNSLQVRMKEKLMGKKFLIVLDDVWEEDYVKWEELMKPFKDGAQGSKIIVTTRSEEVAHSMGTVDHHYLKQLEDEQCWKLFAKHASGGINGDFTVNSTLQRIGREIVKKCKGLPLAAKALGGVLRSTTNVGRWKQILESDIWESTYEQSKILPALKLSYHYLPPHLKRCFAYCSIFPKDYEFIKDELVLLWMAENLMGHSERNRRIEVGEGYFDDLVSRSFFQQFGNTPRFVMHDLMVDLARSLSRKNFFLLLDESKNGDEVVMQTSHLGCVIKWHNLDDKKFNDVFEATRLRTFLSLKYNNQWDSPCFSKVVLDNLLLKLKCLRVLSFHKSGITELPDSIGKVKHLCYLDLSFTLIRMLPESVAMLYNLQMLKLNHCEYLKTLPNDMHHLINLRYLDIRGCCNLVEMPGHISKLKGLQMLSIFIVGKDRGSKIGELRDFSGLRGELWVKKLENVVDVKDVSDEANLMDKKHLEKLTLEWSFNYSTDDTQHSKDVLEKLSPNRLLKKLSIYSYQGKKFPAWVGDHSFENIVSVELSRCSNCCCLPPLGQLNSLKTLSISGFDRVMTVGAEFYGTTSANKPFSSLRTLRFKRMSSWETWESIQVEDGGTFGKLIELEISDCHNLTGELPHFFPSLRVLNIYGCEKFVYSLPRMPRLCELEITGYKNKVKTTFSSFITIVGCLEKAQIFDCRNLESLEKLTIYNCADSFKFFPMDFFPTLKALSIIECNKFESLSMSNGQCQDLASLSSLRITKCPEFVSFPKGGLPASNLSTLEIFGCKKLKRLPGNMHNLLTSLKTLEIKGCPEIERFPKGGLPVSLLALTISSSQLLNCNKLIASWSNWNLQRLFNLKHLTIRLGGDVEFLPEKGLLPTTLTYLSISGFPKLRALDQNGLQQLTSLKLLKIYGCLELQTIPEEGFPDSLEELHIYDCSNLQRIPEQGFRASLKMLIIEKCPVLQKIRVEGLPFLEELSIFYCRKLQMLPEEGFLASLKTLNIKKCPELQKIRVERLPSLEELDISNCQKLQIKPEEGFPASLTRLIIWQCPLLENLCRPENGEYWSKIRHIPCIKINFDVFE